MAKYDDIVEGYRDKQGDLRRQIARLKSQIRMGSAEAGTYPVSGSWRLRCESMCNQRQK